MDHETAIRLRATERYLSGDLTSEEREQFEEHYFECTDCGESVRMGAMFDANARAWFREDAARQAAAKPRERAKKAGLFAWLNWQPVFGFSLAANGAMAALLCVIGLRTIPALRHQLADATAPHFYDSVFLRAPVRGDAGTRQVGGAGPMIGLRFDLPEAQHFHGFRYAIVKANGNAEGAEVESHTVDAPAAQSAQLQLLIPTSKLPGGELIVIVFGEEDNKKEVEIARSRLEYKAERN